MQRTARIFTKRFWPALGLVVMLTVMAGGQVLAAALSQAEKDWLLYMREEEKLARDVYIALYAEWSLTIFNNISQSEQKHMDAVKTLLDRYGLQDPAGSNDPGVFKNPYIQTMYDDLIAKGILSKRDALEVGVIIEETDIDDLEAALTVTVHRDIDRVYANLLAGSYNHLEAFESKLEKY